MTIDDVKAVLRELGLQSEWVTEQTAFCILALSDSRPRQGLLAGHASLSDGARIHDILNFVRRELGRQVAENTREAYRKTSLNPLVEVGWAVRHQLSTNDPNTYYRLHPSYANLLALAPGPERDALIAGLRLRRQEAAHQMSDLQNDVPVRVTAGRIHTSARENTPCWPVRSSRPWDLRFSATLVSSIWATRPPVRVFRTAR